MRRAAALGLQELAQLFVVAPNVQRQPVAQQRRELRGDGDATALVFGLQRTQLGLKAVVAHAVSLHVRVAGLLHLALFLAQVLGGVGQELL